MTPRLVALLLSAWVGLAAAAGPVPEDARRHVVRGLAAMEIAKGAEGFRLAIDEFRQAAAKAPEWPEAHLHLAKAMAKAGDHAGAIASYRRYLQLAPNAPDAAAASDEIIRLEFFQEQAARGAALSGPWGDYRLQVSGTRFRASSGNTRVTGVVTGVLHRDGSVMHDWTQPVQARSEVTFEGEIEGAAVRGVRRQAAYLDEGSNCQVPAQEGPFTGTFSEARDRLVLRFPEMTYRAEMVDDAKTRYCKSLVRAGPREAETVLLPDHVRGDIGVMTRLLKRPDGRYQEIFLVEAGSPAERAGLAYGDVILAVDGVESRNRLPGDYLRGTPGTTVAVVVERAGERREFKAVRSGPEPADEARWPPAGIGARILARVDAAGRPDPAGDAVIAVVPDGAAARAGMESGDVIVSVDGKPVHGLRDAEVARLLRGAEGAPVDIVFRRASATPRAVAGVRARLVAHAPGYLGLHVFLRAARKDGTAEVSGRVKAGSPAEKAGMPRGDKSPWVVELLAFDGIPLPVLTTGRIEALLQGVVAGETVRIDYRVKDSSPRTATIVAAPRGAGD